MKMLEELNRRLTEDGLEVEVDASEDYTLRLALPGLGEEEDKAVFLEISKIPMDEAVEYGYYYFFTVLATDVAEDRQTAALSRLNDFNLEAVIGSYGLISEGGTVYHKYVAKINLSDDAKAADDLYNALVDTIANVDNSIDEVIRVIA